MNETLSANDANAPVLQAPKNTKKIILTAGTLLVGVGASIGVGYAAWAGYLPNPLVKRPTAEQMLAALQSMNSAKTTVNITLAIEPRAEDVEPLDFSLFLNEEMSEELLGPIALQTLPSDLRLDLSIASSFAKQQEGANEETRIQGTYAGNNVSANIDLTTRTVEGTTYVKPDAIPLPIPVFDLNALEGKWVDLENESKEQEEVFTYTDLLLTDIEESEEKKKNTDIQKEMFTLLEQGIKNGAIIFSVPERITYKDERAWHTDAVIDGEKLRETVIAIGDAREELFPDAEEYMLFTDDFIEASAKERGREIYRELFRRFTLSATMKDDGAPLMLAFSTRLAPKLQENILKDRQITLETEIHIEGINIPVNVSAPTEALAIEEAINLIAGADPKMIRRDKQTETVSDIQSALEMYYEKNKEYPSALNELLGTADEFQTVTAIPNDILTNAPYIYEKTETGYTLKFQVEESVEEDYSFYGKTVAGTNTATEAFFSEEGAKETDEDEDGITLYDEVTRYKTSDLSTDSDYDGFSDAEEISAGYNPAGEGTLM